MSILLPSYLEQESVRELPVYECLQEIFSVLYERDELVLKAAPGAGKTSLVPLALLDFPSLKSQKIMMLEPRRLAAKGAAERMASILGEKVGQTVGYRMRLETRVSAVTRIEVVTEGVYLKLLQDDPSLDGVGLVIFDEFHERSLDADLALALTLQSRELFRNKQDGDLALKLILMSATLDDERVPALISSCESQAPIVESVGRQYPVDIVYQGPRPDKRQWLSALIKTILTVINQESGSVLVFLPGRGEIKRTEEHLKETLSPDAKIVVCPLYGDLSLQEQTQAIKPCEPGFRKIVLATSIAESSLTIEGVRVVIDLGLNRSAQFDPRTGLTRLATRNASKASSTQRSGRAGRLESGRCYRLWGESEQAALPTLTSPEILQADLASLVLSTQAWGVENPNDLVWLDAPPKGAIEQAYDLLLKLGALEKADNSYRITEHGQAIHRLGVHPRIAHLLVLAQSEGQTELGARLALLLTEKEILSAAEREQIGASFEGRLSLIDKKIKKNSMLAKQLELYRTLATKTVDISKNSKPLALDRKPLALDSEPLAIDSKPLPLDSEQYIGLLLACAYPDRVAKLRRSKSQDYLLANGRAAVLEDSDPLYGEQYLVIPNLGGLQGNRTDRIFMAAPFHEELFEHGAHRFNNIRSQVVEGAVVHWDKKKDCFVAENQRKYGHLVLSSEPLNTLPDKQKERALLEFVKSEGLSLFNIDSDLEQWMARVRFIGRHSILSKLSIAGLEEWPDFSKEVLIDLCEHWLSGSLSSIKKREDFKRIDLKQQLSSLLPWPMPQLLDELAPEKIQVASGSRAPVDYKEDPPVLAVKLQELFGTKHTPKLFRNSVTLKLHLLSPAKRPLAVTQDLETFWEAVYPEVKKEMKGRYPKHPWPDDPLSAVATAKTKKYM